jgi:hypothetical protein
MVDVFENFGNFAIEVIFQVVFEFRCEFRQTVVIFNQESGFLGNQIFYLLFIFLSEGNLIGFVSVLEFFDIFGDCLDVLIKFFELF